VRRQKNFKLNVIANAAKIFNLSDFEKEKLANQAGLTFKKDKSFQSYLNSIILKYPAKQKIIYDRALLSERMFRHIKTDYNPAKTSLLALAISLELKIDEIEILLQKAGYVLSASIAFDMVVKWLLINHKTKKNLLWEVNDILYELNLPLLMAREKS